jgi:hypothetical protein
MNNTMITVARNPIIIKSNNLKSKEIDKIYPQFEIICWNLLVLIKSYSWVCYSWYQSPDMDSEKNSKEDSPRD